MKGTMSFHMRDMDLIDEAVFIRCEHKRFRPVELLVYKVGNWTEEPQSAQAAPKISCILNKVVRIVADNVSADTDGGANSSFCQGPPPSGTCRVLWFR